MRGTLKTFCHKYSTWEKRNQLISNKITIRLPIIFFWLLFQLFGYFVYSFVFGRNIFHGNVIRFFLGIHGFADDQCKHNSSDNNFDWLQEQSWLEERRYHGNHPLRWSFFSPLDATKITRRYFYTQYYTLVILNCV